MDKGRVYSGVGCGHRINRSSYIVTLVLFSAVAAGGTAVYRTDMHAMVAQRTKCKDKTPSAAVNLIITIIKLNSARVFVNTNSFIGCVFCLVLAAGRLNSGTLNDPQDLCQQCV